MTNIVVGPALEIGGNTAQMTSKGKIQITNSQGKIKTLSRDEFKRNLIKNADKINNGEDFEFKKSHKFLKIFAAAIGTAAVASTVVYRKQISKYLKDFSFKKLWNNVKDLWGDVKKPLKRVFGKKELGLQSRKTFIQNEPDSVLKSKRTKYMNKNNVDARRQRREALKAKFANKGIHFDLRSKIRKNVKNINK